MSRVDLNADLGELPGTAGRALDGDLLQIVTSANVAAGGHAGDPDSMAWVCDMAAQRGVRIGAHLSFEDRAGFGRRVPDQLGPSLVGDLQGQLTRLQQAADAVGTCVDYVKPHGALYNLALDDDRVAELVVSAVLESSLPILTMTGSALDRTARAAGLTTYGEFFADRGYLSSGRLVPRSQEHALVTDGVDARAVQAAVEHVVICVDGTAAPITCDSICVHGDTPGAVAHARGVRTTLEQHGIELASFLPAHPR